jgi:hypothetical protein
MLRENIVSNYTGKHIKLFLKDYALKGTIRKIDSGSIIFESDKGLESAIALEAIYGIVLLNQ